MKVGKIGGMVLICVLMAVALNVPAKAAAGSTKEPLRIDALASEKLDEGILEDSRGQIGSRAAGSLDVTVSPYKARKADSSFPLEAEQTVTLNCSYTPNSASVDFGLIAPNGYFYYLNSTTGTINQEIQVGERGQYTLAVRNNSSQKVSVLGYVYY